MTVINGEDGEGEDITVPAGLGDPVSWPTGTLLATAGRLIERAWNRRLADSGITASGAGVLIALDDGPHSQAELAGVNRVSEQSMGRTIDRLERQGLLDRRPHDTDRRRVVVSRTRQGEAVLRAALHGQSGATSVFDQLPDHGRLRADLVQLIQLLDPRP